MQSGNHSEHPPPNHPSHYRTADGIIRSILNDNASPADISPSGELYRAIERFHSLRRSANTTPRDPTRDHLSRWASHSSSRNSMSSESNSEPQRRFSREPQSSDASPLYNLPPAPPTLPPLRGYTARRGHRAAQYRIRRRSVLENSTETDDDALDVWGQVGSTHQASHGNTRRSITDHNAHSQSPLDDGNLERLRDERIRTFPNFSYTPSNPYSELSFPSPPLQPQEPAEENHRVKRRKLDSDRLSPTFQGFRYGKYGQVEPGQLTMELVSCDGGIFSDNGQKYAIENILKNDQTVYCTEGPRCNIVLKHQGKTVFTLKELIIKAPRSNFTSPVQEGMVFVSMTLDYLMTRTAQYQIQYSPPRSTSRRIERETQPLAPIVSIRHNDDGSTMTHAQARARRLYNIGMEDEDNDLRVAQIPSEFNVSPPPFRVTTECSDDEADDPNPRVDWRAPDRIGSLPFESDDSDEGGDPDDFPFGRTDYRLRRRRNRSSTALAEAAEAAQVATQEAVRAVGGELMAPHARFFIERNKSKCTIKFEPPVSGRFILLKMWSPHRDPNANIDIQAVMAKGYAGPRFFPSVELR
ncbi:hypothetical protein F5X99DRAFT_414963 [Biscogniauxia marginata]|nr:hypothetical protein F5X99DRAFT_414963 [Biscogniauxia marginata]